MQKTKKTKQSENNPVDKYDAPFASHLRAFMNAHPHEFTETETPKKTTQKELADYLGVRPQTVSYYCNGESLPNCEQLLRIAEYFGETCDFLMTGRRPEHKEAHEMFGLSETTINDLKLVNEGYFADCPNMLAALDCLLMTKGFYQSLEYAMHWYDRREERPAGHRTEQFLMDGTDAERWTEFCEWKAAQYMQDFMIDFFSRNIVSVHKKMQEYGRSNKEE